MDVLQWDLSAVTPYSILDHILRTVSFGPMFEPEVVRKHAETFVALAATEHLFSLKSPITVAVACLGAAIRGLNPQSLEDLLSSIFMTCGQIHTVSYLALKLWRAILLIDCCYVFDHGFNQRLVYVV